MDIHALHRQGMTISEIARRTHHDRKTIRAYLNGERAPEVRQPAGPDTFEVFVDHVAARLTEDPHLWAATLLHELRLLVDGSRCNDIFDEGKSADPHQGLRKGAARSLLLAKLLARAWHPPLSIGPQKSQSRRGSRRYL